MAGAIMSDRRFMVAPNEGNRAQRRQAEKNERRGITHTERVVPLPGPLDEFTVFDIPQRVLDQLKNGAIDAVANDDDELTPVFRDNTGELTEVIPAMLGWVETWEMISEKLDLSLSLRCLKFLCAGLHREGLITPQLIAAAHEELNACRHIFRTTNRKQIISIAKTAQLKILLEPKINQDIKQ